MSELNEDDIRLVMKQTDCQDVALVKNTLIRNNYDILNTICSILEIQTNQQSKQRKSEDEKTKGPFQDTFEEFRNILNEKDQIYHSNLNSNAQKR